MLDTNLRRHLTSLTTRRAVVRTPGRLAAAAGRAEMLLEQIEPRVMLAGDHPSLPAPWTPSPPASAVTLDTASAVTDPLLGSGTINGEITAGDPGDLFSFVLTGVPGRTKDFVSILADTIGPASTLDTFVEVYDSNGVLIQTGADNGTGAGLSGAITIGLNALVPAAQRAPDGWLGFEGTVGATYYIRVRAQTTPVTGRTATGMYTLKIDAATLEQTVNQDPDLVIMGQTIPNIDFGRAFAEHAITAIQGDVIYRITTPDDARFDGLATFQAISDDNTQLNPHVEVYSIGNAQGVVQRLATDTDAGRQTDSYTTHFTNRNTTYYIRVRADDFRAALAGGQPVGVFQMLARFAANNIAIDDVMRLGQSGRAITAFDDPVTPWTNIPLRTYSINPNARQGTDSNVFKFTAQGTGLGIITIVSQVAIRGLELVPRLPQPALRLYDQNGVSLDFNKGNGSAQLLFSVVGDQTYYFVVEGFDNAADGAFRIFIEAHHTFDPTQPVDDHVDTLGDLATPIRFGDPFQPPDNEGQPSRDRTWLQTGVGRGRIHNAGDVDVFQFTAPVNQLSVYAGDDGNQTTPLYVGGNFGQVGTDPRTGDPHVTDNVGIWDAGSWFNAGPGAEADGAINGPIFAMAAWDIDGAGAGPAVLAVGGQFTMVGGMPALNIAFRVFDAANGRYVWSTDPLSPDSAFPVGIPGPVFSLGAGDVIPVELQGVIGPELYIGGQFSILGFNNVISIFDVGGALGATNMNGGVTGAGAAVRAITFWNPPVSAAFPARPVDPAAMPAPTNTTPPVTSPDLPLQVYFGGTFANGFAANPALQPYPNTTSAPAPSPFIPGPITGINNVAHWGIRNVTGDLVPTLQGNGLPIGYDIVWGNTAALPPTAGAAVGKGFGVNGPVNALTVWDDPGQRNVNGALADIPERLIIGGAFTGSGAVSGPGAANVAAPPAVATPNIIAYDMTQPGTGMMAGFPPNVPTVPPLPRYQALVMGIAQGTVRALTTWHPAIQDASGNLDNDTISVLLAAGDDMDDPLDPFDPVALGVLQQLVSSGVFVPGGGAWQNIITADDGTIRAIAVFENNGIGVAPGTNPDGTLIDFETIYIGGDFTTLGGMTFAANRVSRLEIRLNIPAVIWGNMRGGTQGVSPGEAPGSISQVFALTTFDDDITGIWDRNERPATKVSIVLSKTADSRITDALIRVFDSTFNLIYTNDTLDPTGQNDVPGANDPTLFPAFPNPGVAGWVQPMAPFPGFSVWAGEVYYVVVSDQGGGTGRYTLQVNTDALPPRPDPATQDQLGVYPDDISVFGQPVGFGQFANAPEIQLSGTGKGRPFLDPLADPATPPSAYSTRNFRITPGGRVRAEFSDPPVISRVTDTMLFQFRAPNDGTAEIRLSTFNIVRAFQEVISDQDGNLVSATPRAKLINSPLHGALRAFNNDFVQLGYSNGNQAVQGFGQFTPAVNPDANANPPENGVRAYLHDDPRLVFNVQRGNVYFIQVESAFKGTFELDPNLVDWRFATGAYDLVINSTPSFGGVDDVWPNFDLGGQDPVNGLDGTFIPIDRLTGAGTISGIIDNIASGPFANPNDADTFGMIAEGRGFVTVQIIPTDPVLAPRVRVFTETQTNGQFSWPLVTTQSGGVGGTATAQFPTVQGQRFFIVVDGAGTEGRYTINVASPIQTDDQLFSPALPNDITNPIAGWANAGDLSLNRFLGVYGARAGGIGAVGPLQGSIENPADQDIYKFTAEAYEIATAHVNRVDNAFDPAVLVYEISFDGAGREVFLLIGNNDDETVNNINSTVSFSVTPGRDYYVIVSGSNAATHFGRYALSVNVAPTDDHPNNPLLPAPVNTPDPAQATDFPNGTIIGLTFDSVNFTSTGAATGAIERATDTDLFRFTAQASGIATIVIARATMPASTLALDLVVLNSNNSPIGGLTVTPGGGGANITITGLSVVQGQQYYLLVRANATVPPGDTDTGAYALSITTDPVDDFLPTPGTATPAPSDFTGAPAITINTINGVGTQAGVLVPTGDSDLFRFTSLAGATGAVTVRISTPSSTLNPKVLIFDSTQTLVFTALGNGDSATVTYNTTASQLYYVLVLATDGAVGTAAVGTYTVTVTVPLPGGGGGGGGPDDYPNAGEFNDAVDIGLDARTGNGAISGVITPSSDTDLFKFTVPGNGFVDIQLNTPSGGLVDGQIKIFNAAHTLIFSDSAGLLGATAALRFAASAGEVYFLLVEPVGAVTGSYTLRVAAQPTTHFLYFPEGFAGSTIDEFVPIVNPNSFTVSYEIYARYETGANPNTPIFTGSIAPGQRGGVTISQHTNLGASLVRIGEPYALEIRSTGPLGASFSHYDFGASIGESFTNRISTTWTFADVNKDRNNFRDFLLVYNPGNTTANINVVLYYQDGTTLSIPFSVDALRRGGLNFDADARVTKTGKFGVKVISDQPIVANVTSYNLPRSGGDGLLGDADGGNTLGVVTNVSSGGGVTSALSVLNTNSQPATVTITADYGRTDIPKLIRVYVVNPGSQFTRSLADVGLISGQTAGITYTSNIPVTFQVTEYKLGDGDTTTTITSAARQFFFGDLFVNPSLAGIKYIEQMGIYNPSAVAIDITATFLFADGSPSLSTTISVGASTFKFVAIDQQPIILGRPGPTGFSVVLSSATPFAASLTHYDLFLNGGWSAGGAPIGLTTPLPSILA